MNPTELLLPSPIHVLESPLLKNKRVQVFVKRDDLIHPHISGNKWRKLSLNIEAMRFEKKKGILSFGGAFSNHLYALAAAGNLFKFETIGLVRGEEVENSCLSFCRSNGMQLHFLDRVTYRQKEEPEFLQTLSEKYSDYFIVPEGGANSNGIEGAKEIVTEINTYKQTFDYFFLAAGTGTTAAGICFAFNSEFQIGIIPVLKGDWMQAHIESLATADYDQTKVHYFNNFHFGGYAKYQKELIDFINTFKEEYHIPLDPIYTGKLFYGVFKLIKEDFFKPGEKIILLHSGGLQGITGFNTRFGELIHP